jgi:pimeloyl-ACP methyl ester carboxylesterase
MDDSTNTPGTPSGMLKVPGASLYYAVRGAGSPLLILQGGAGNADASERLARALADRFTVITYDRRGLSRSSVEAPVENLRLEVHTDDAHRLLQSFGPEPAWVFGSSMGALIGIDLVARHPEQVRLLVAHEPPVSELLPEEERAAAESGHAEIQKIFQSDGLAAAMKKILEASGVDFNDREEDVLLPQMTGDPREAQKRAADMTFLMRHDAPAAHRYRLDREALKAHADRIVVAAGESSSRAWPHRAAAALARFLGSRMVTFPGGHTGSVLRPRAFAEQLDRIFRDAARSAET